MQSKAVAGSAAAAEAQAGEATAAQAVFAAAAHEMSSLQREHCQVAEQWQFTTEAIAR